MLSFLAFWIGGAGAPEEAPPEVDGSGLIVTSRKRRRDEPSYKLHPEEIARQQREEARYLAELEKNAQQAPATARRGKTGDAPVTGPGPETTTPAAPQLPDAIARAASAKQVIERARASSAEALAKAKADERRRMALLLLALD